VFICDYPAKKQNAYMALQLSHRGYVMENGMFDLESNSAKLLHDESVKKGILRHSKTACHFHFLTDFVLFSFP
jgi:hypothetical protein